MKMKGKTVLAGLAVVGLLATLGAGTALAQQRSAEGPEDRLSVGGDLEGPSPTEFPILVDLETVVDVLGLTQEELDRQIMAGKSLAEVAGKEKTQELIDAIVDTQKERIESERAAGRLSDEEATEAIKDLREQVTEMVNWEVPGEPVGVSKSGS